MKLDFIRTCFGLRKANVPQPADGLPKAPLEGSPANPAQARNPVLQKLANFGDWASRTVRAIMPCFCPRIDDADIEIVRVDPNGKVAGASALAPKPETAKPPPAPAVSVSRPKPAAAPIAPAPANLVDFTREVERIAARNAKEGDKLPLVDSMISGLEKLQPDERFVAHKKLCDVLARALSNPKAQFAMAVRLACTISLLPPEQRMEAVKAVAKSMAGLHSMLAEEGPVPAGPGGEGAKPSAASLPGYPVRDAIARQRDKDRLAVFDVFLLATFDSRRAQFRINMLCALGHALPMLPPPVQGEALSRLMQRARADGAGHLTAVQAFNQHRAELAAIAPQQIMQAVFGWPGEAAAPDGDGFDLPAAAMVKILNDGSTNDPAYIQCLLRTAMSAGDGSGERLVEFADALDQLPESLRVDGFYALLQLSSQVGPDVEVRLAIALRNKIAQLPENDRRAAQAAFAQAVPRLPPVLAQELAKSGQVEPEAAGRDPGEPASAPGSPAPPSPDVLDEFHVVESGTNDSGKER